MLYLPTELAPAAEEPPPFEGGTASSVAPRRRLEFHRLSLRRMQTQILRLQAELNAAVVQMHHHIAGIDAVLRMSVCLTVEEHARLSEAAILHDERRRVAPATYAAAAAGVSGGRAHRRHTPSDSSE